MEILVHVSILCQDFVISCYVSEMLNISVCVQSCIILHFLSIP